MRLFREQKEYLNYERASTTNSESSLPFIPIPTFRRIHYTLKLYLTNSKKQTVFYYNCITIMSEGSWKLDTGC